MYLKKRAISFSILALIIALSYILLNIDDFNRSKSEKLYLATSTDIINERGEHLTLNNIETQELVATMGSLPLSKDIEIYKSSYRNNMKFYINDNCIYELNFSTPEFDMKTQILIKNKPYIINKNFYNKLLQLEEKYNYNLDT
jgi:hypothetical protein